MNRWSCARLGLRTFDLRIRPVSFSLKRFLADPAGYNKNLEGILYGN